MDLDLPEVRRCFGVFPPKYATYLISLFGIATGGLGIAGIILYGIAENLIMSIFSVTPSQLDDDIKKLVLVTLGLSSILLLVANAFLLIGSVGKKRGAVTAGVMVLFILCLLIIVLAISGPVACFFIPDTCLVKKVSIPLLTLALVFVTFYLEIWLYFMTVAWNYEQEL